MLNRIWHCSQVLALVSISCVGQSNISPRFEVASVRPLPGNSWGAFSGGPGSSDPERITFGELRWRT